MSVSPTIYMNANTYTSQLQTHSTFQKKRKMTQVELSTTENHFQVFRPKINNFLNIQFQNFYSPMIFWAFHFSLTLKRNIYSLFNV